MGKKYNISSKSDMRRLTRDLERAVRDKANELALNNVNEENTTMPELTKDADKMICVLYKEYLTRRKHEISKRDSKAFGTEFFQIEKAFSSWLSSDLSDTKLELGQKKYLKLFIGGDFEITDQTIIYMENRFKDGLSSVLDFISKFIP